MENPEEVLHSLEEFSKMKPKDIPRELEEYLCFVAKTGNPIYQWPTVKSLFREKLLSVITEFYETCPTVDIPPCPNVELFNYDMMKNFILEKLDTFASAPFTVQRLCELLTAPRKEYNRIDKYMRALEKNILVVSTTEPGRRSTENGEGVMNGIETEHIPESSNSSHDINIEDMDESPSWPRVAAQVTPVLFESDESERTSNEAEQTIEEPTSFEPEPEAKDVPTSSTHCEPEVQHQETVITCTSSEDTNAPFVSIEAVPIESCVTSHQDVLEESSSDVSVTITAIPANVQQRRTSIERLEEKDPVHVAEAEVKSPFAIEETKLVENTQLQVVQEEVVVSESSTEPTEILKVDEEQSTNEAEVAAPVCKENIPSDDRSPSPEMLQAEVSSGSEKPRIDKATEDLETLNKEVENEENEAKQSENTDISISTDTEVIETASDFVPEPISSTVSAEEAEVENIVDSSTDSKENEVSEKCKETIETCEEMKIEEMKFEEMKVEEMKVEEMRVEEMRVEEMKVEEMKVEEMKVEESEEKPIVTEVSESNKETEETAMELDVVTEDTNKKPGESEEPSSSVDVSL